MHSAYGRLLSRSIVNGLYNCSSSSSSSGASRTAVANATNENVSTKSIPKLVSAVAGFPKSFKSGKVRKGQIGDDAWLVKNVDSADVLGKCYCFSFIIVLSNIHSCSFSCCRWCWRVERLWS